MTAPKQAVETENGRYYTIPGYEDTTFVSVTNTINALSKPALYNAYAKRAGVRAVDQEAEWHAIQQEEGDEAAKKWIARGMRDYADYTSALGSGAHALCEMYSEARYDTQLHTRILPPRCMEKVAHHAEKMAAYEGNVNQAYAKMQRLFEQYCKFIEDAGAEILATEMTVCNPELGYAGTLDNIVRITGGISKNYVLDIKTGGVYPDSVPLQLSAYRHATHATDGAKTWEQDIPIDGAIVLQLKPQSYKAEYVRSDVVVFRKFLAVQAVWEWQHGMSKEAVGSQWR